MTPLWITVTCPKHGEFPAGIALEPGQSASFVGSDSTCPFDGEPIPIPDGTYTATAFGITRSD